MDNWRSLGAAAADIADPKVIFGPFGDRILVPTALMIMALGVMGAAEAISHLMY